MDTRKIRHAVVLSRHLNFSRAAQILNITQSALSRSIQSLEAESRIVLFQRSRSAISLTDAGKEFIKYSEDLLLIEEGIRGLASQVPNSESEKTSFGVSSFVAHTLLFSVLSKTPGIHRFRANITVDSPKVMLAKIADGSLSFCISTGQETPPSSPIGSIPIAKFPLGLLVRATHPLVGSSPISLSDARNFSIIRSHAMDHVAVHAFDIGMVQDMDPRLTISNYTILRQLTMNFDYIWAASPLAELALIKDRSIVELESLYPENRPHGHIYAYYGKRSFTRSLFDNLVENFTAVSAELLREYSDFRKS